jgi:hypothetical protein
VLWALAQPAAVAGLVAAFVLGLGLRWAAQRATARLLGVPDAAGGPIEPLGVVAALLGGTGWGGLAGRQPKRVVLAGPLAVIGASQVALAAYTALFPELGLPLRLNRPSDVLHGAIAPNPAAQFLMSVAVGLLCFGLLALVPLPPLDGYRLLLAVPGPMAVAERLGVIVLLVLLVVPVAGEPPLLTALDAVAGPVVRAWAA